MRKKPEKANFQSKANKRENFDGRFLKYVAWDPIFNSFNISNDEDNFQHFNNNNDESFC